MFKTNIWVNNYGDTGSHTGKNQVKMAYYTIKSPKTSKKGYFRRFFEIFPFDEISTVGSVKDTCLGIQSWGSWTVTLQSE